MNGLGKKEKIGSKNSKKNSKHLSENATCEQKTTIEKANFCLNTFFSLYSKITPPAKKTLPQFDFKNHENV